MDRRRAIALALVAAALYLSTSGVSISGAAADATSVPRWPAWLCKPGAAHDWCLARLTTTVIDANGSHSTVDPALPGSPPIDCFYVYPSVSTESTPNSNLVVQTSEEDVAVDEASPFSQVCRVFAPMYNQVTANAGVCIFGVCSKQGSYGLEYRDILAAWRDYLAHDNDGRGVVLVGHSEGANLLNELLDKVIDRSPAQRSLIVSAILVGGGAISMPDIGARDTAGIALCRSSTQIDCLVAYSAFDRTPPADASFETVDNPRTEHIPCVNPVDPGTSAATAVTPWFPSFDSGGMAPINYGARYYWIEFPHLYTVRCVSQGTRSWLLVSRIHTPGDRRPAAQAVAGPGWGLHEADMTIDLPQLVSLVRDESAAYRSKHRG